MTRSPLDLAAENVLYNGIEFFLKLCLYRRSSTSAYLGLLLSSIFSCRHIAERFGEFLPSFIDGKLNQNDTPQTT